METKKPKDHKRPKDGKKTKTNIKTPDSKKFGLIAVIAALLIIAVIIVTSSIPEKNPIVTIEMDNGDLIRIELYPKVAPNTVKNFISLINKGFYNGLTFHRIVEGFVIQGGDPLGDGTGGPGYSIKGEFTANKFRNNLKHERGVVSMARAQDPDSAGSQFFICVADVPALDGLYAAFGKVIEGMDVVDDIVSAETVGGRKDPYNETPANPRIMKKVTVELFGRKYGEPDVIR